MNEQERKQMLKAMREPNGLIELVKQINREEAAEAERIRNTPDSRPMRADLERIRYRKGRSRGMSGPSL